MRIQINCWKKKIWTNYGVRPLAMGNAFVAIADDENAFNYNVAGLAFQSPSRDYLPFELQASTRAVSNLIEYLSEVAASNSTDALLDLIDDNLGEVNSFDIRYNPWYFNGVVGVNPQIRKYGTVIVHRQPTMEIETGLELLVPFSAAYAFLNKKLALGTNLNIKLKRAVEDYFTADIIEDYSSVRRTVLMTMRTLVLE